MTTMYQPGFPDGVPAEAQGPQPMSNRIHGPVARWVTAGTTVVTAGALAGYLFFVDPNNPSNAYPQCPLKQLTGIDCPGCGGLRATHAMVHGDIAGILDHNVLALLVVPLIAYALTRWVLGLFDKKLPPFRLPYVARYAVPIGVLVFTIVRNIPSQPLYYLNSALA